jgi:hypothetical protein
VAVFSRVRPLNDDLTWVSQATNYMYRHRRVQKMPKHCRGLEMDSSLMNGWYDPLK